MSQSFETFGKYILLEKIQTGGMAEIYLAKKPGASGVSRFFAIKRILPQFSEQHEFVEMFKDEAKITVNLSHANICPIFEFGVEKNQFYLAMDYIEGRNLRQILNKMKKSGVSFSIEQVLYIIKEVAAGLDHAHRCIDANTGKPLNIIHRDMSPQNVMVSFEGEVKVVDFGIAKAETQLDNTRAGTLKGKFGYMSPEQAEGQNVDLRTDIFALGIVLWELLANDRLFVANNEVNTLRKVRDCQIPSLRKINPNIPQELERVVSKALAKDKNLRYQTAAAFHRELSRFLNRQYPDFSPHDFSVFIKTLFAAEILESRKKMVEFARFDVKTDSESTQLTPPPQRQRERDDLMTSNSMFSSSATFTESTTNPDEHSDPRPKPPVKPSPPQSVPPPPLKQDKPRPPMPAAPPARESWNSKQLMVDHMSYHERERALKDGTYNSIVNGASVGSRSFSHVSVKSGGWSISSAAPVALIIASIGIGGVAFNQTNPAFLARVKGVLGFGTETTIASKDPGAGQPAKPSVPSYAVVVISTPSNAQIFVNDQPQADLTPTTLQLPQNTEAKIKVMLPGFATFEQNYKIDGNKSINVTLQAEKVGKLDVNVVGSGNIFIDGKLVAQGSPLTAYPVHANKEILVRVEDPVTKAADEVRVKVAENAVKRITLIPRASGWKKPDAPQKQ